MKPLDLNADTKFNLFLTKEVAEKTCTGCIFEYWDSSLCALLRCNSKERDDGKSVIFIRGDFENETL